MDLIAYKYSPEGSVFINDKKRLTPSGLSDQTWPGLPPIKPKLDSSIFTTSFHQFPSPYTSKPPSHMLQHTVTCDVIIIDNEGSQAAAISPEEGDRLAVT